MTKRTYNQFCSIAYALDVIGERWTMLLVRELLYGARRFTDLQRCLPGIGSNLLSRRLKDLEAAGLIEQRQLPPPAGSAVYALTEEGQALQEVSDALTRFGLRYFRFPPDEEEFFGLTPVMTAMRFYFRPERTIAMHLACQLHTADDVCHVLVNDEDLDVGYGGWPAANLVAHSTPATLLLLVGGGVTVAQALENGELSMEKGPAADLQHLFNCFRPEEE